MGDQVTYGSNQRKIKITLNCQGYAFIILWLITITLVKFVFPLVCTAKGFAGNFYVTQLVLSHLLSFVLCNKSYPQQGTKGIKTEPF